LKVEKRAVLHVHTTASDGSGTPRRVIEAALEAGVDILGINDHMNLQVRLAGYGGWHSSLFVLAGAELEDENRRSHVLVYGVDEIPGSGNTREQLAFIKKQGGIAIAAHPTEAPGRLPKTGSYSWKSGTDGLDGVEVWNYMSLWKKRISAWNLPARILRPDNYATDPDPAAIDFWKAVGGCAVAGPDAHALRFGIGGMSLEVFPYEMLFRRMITHVLLDDELSGSSAEAEEVIIEALKRGKCFCSNVLLGRADGFEVLKVEEGLLIRLPGKGDVVVESETGPCGPPATLEPGEHLVPVTGGGVAVVRVLREGRTWIFCGIPG